MRFKICMRDNYNNIIKNITIFEKNIQNEEKDKDF